MHRVGGETPPSFLGTRLSKPVLQHGAPTLLAKPA